MFNVIFLLYNVIEEEKWLCLGVLVKVVYNFNEFI